MGSPLAEGGQGAAYVFEKDGDDWRQIARLAVPGAGPGDSLGSAVAIDGDLALVGATGADSGRGAVHVFRADRSGGWSEVAGSRRPKVPFPTTGSATCSRCRALARSSPRRADGGRGAVFLYGGDGWTQLARIAPDSLTANARSVLQ